MTDRNGTFRGYRGILREITAEYQLSETIAYQATYDSLTGLINRNEFDKRLQESVRRSQRHGTRSALCYLDLDQFKIVNDTVGHLVGDQLLAEVARLLKQCIRPSDDLGRLGGDEFGLILKDTSIEDGSQICERLIQNVRHYRFTWQDRQFNVGITIGMVPILPTTLNPIEVLSRADLACYRSKDLGRGRIYVADANDAELEMRQSQMARIANISQVLEENRFFLVQQPIQALRGTEEQPHAEILLRLYDEEGHVISPGQFIPIAERYGLISLIDRWVVETVVENYNTFFGETHMLVSVNLSGTSLSDDRFIDFVESLIRQAHIDPHYICFEITETVAISHLAQAKVFIRAMKELGVKFALDDFGSGVSSFGYLRSLPVDYLKIDGGLVRNIVHERCDRAIVDLVNQVAHMMNMRTIAEFVEDDKTIEQLKQLNVDYAQGYAIGKITKLEEGLTRHS
ncbi:MAG: EAL domain-containing protein [Cyanobacteria bacterium P01_F01_bin.150]